LKEKKTRKGTVHCAKKKEKRKDEERETAPLKRGVQSSALHKTNYARSIKGSHFTLAQLNDREKASVLKRVNHRQVEEKSEKEGEASKG